jgi:hypothetical protein
LETGYIHHAKGEAPECVLGPIGNKIECPGDDFREDLRVWVKISDDPAGPRELLSTAASLWAGLDQLHDQFLAAAATHTSQVPVCVLEDVREIKNAYGNVSYQPCFRIDSWTARPPDLPATAAPSSQQPPPPKPKPKPAPKRVDLDDEIPF